MDSAGTVQVMAAMMLMSLSDVASLWPDIHSQLVPTRGVFTFIQEQWNTQHTKNVAGTESVKKLKLSYCWESVFAFYSNDAFQM